MTHEMEKTARDAWIFDGIAEGPYHQITAEMRMREKRGEFFVAWNMASEPRRGLRRIPYLRLRSAREMRRRFLLRTAGWGVLGVSTLASSLAALWHARHVLLTGLGALLAIGGIIALALLSNHKPGCIGLHCPGCKG